MSLSGKRFVESDGCYQQFADGGEEEDDASIPTPWTDANEAVLVVLRNAPIEMADTLYGWVLVTQKRDTKRAYQHMDAEERTHFCGGRWRSTQTMPKTGNPRPLTPPLYS